MHVGANFGEKIDFFAKIGPDMHETKCRGARDLSVVKFSAPYDAWRSTKRRKNETEKFRKIANFERPFTPETMLRLASNFGKMRFRRSPTFHFSRSKTFFAGAKKYFWMTPPVGGGVHDPWFWAWWGRGREGN